jgi:hypothetical protein
MKRDHAKSVPPVDVAAVVVAVDIETGVKRSPGAPV